ncbi:hypothetical protein MNBD_GAMMA26-443 [hydrothermal vent metagenome]|uniref:LPS-assembly lipoprotein LptE n=1 Tax=hydrothermal vent metagenome TaxID=652676 RepID=A0A3B1B3T3_9ZZZZ
MTHRKTRLLTWIFTILILTTLQGCGFQLRGEVNALPPSVSPIYIHGLAKFDPFSKDLKQILKEAKVQVTEDRAAAKTALQIFNQSRDRRVLAVDNRGKVVEYEIHHALEFSLIAADGSKLVPAQTVGTQYTYENPETGVLGKQQEENLRGRDVRLDLARRIVTRLHEQLR